jgi:hypothetical protein
MQSVRTVIAAENSNTAPAGFVTHPKKGKSSEMHLSEKIKEAAAAGYILLWLLGIPIPVLFLIFLLRGCS